MRVETTRRTANDNTAGKLRVLDLFSGIGGFSLGLERTGFFETAAFCEIDPFPRRVLAKHWPGVKCYEDVRTLTADTLRTDGINKIDVITGGFPCQDLSEAGKRRGIGAERSGLWGQIARLTCELQPKFVLVENVSNLLSGPSEQPGGWFGKLLGDLAEIGYDAEWHSIPASAVGAPQPRDRVWIIADRPESGWNRSSGYPVAKYVVHDNAQWPHAARRSWGDLVAWLKSNDSSHLWNAPDGTPRRMVDGVLRGLDSPAVGACGNSVVPQIPYAIGMSIAEAIGLAANDNAAPLTTKRKRPPANDNVPPTPDLFGAA